jgi:2-polyprenyl-6-methoxyphenol hydroxylase-like FAD-dependent oxidoreductase
MQKLKIGIIGASIAGATIAILLDRLGFNITVFERRGVDAMNDLGAGIVLPPDLVAELKKNDLFDDNFPMISLDERVFLLKNESDARLLTTIPMSALAVNWNTMYQQLAKRLSKNKVMYQAKVIKIIQKNQGVSLITNHGTEYQFDIVICADGYRSLGRELLFPGTTSKFTNYICWQGNYIINNNHVLEKIQEKAFYYLYPKGILLAYAIPYSPLGSKAITWFLYELLNENHPIFRDNNAHKNLYENEVTPEYLMHLQDLMTRNFPLMGQEIVTRTQNPFTHAIYDTMVPRYFANGVALIGDAGILLRPHLGSGATKALQDALSLYQHLQTYGDINVAFNTWGEERQKSAASLFNLSRAFGDFLVTKPPQWNKVSEETFKDMWRKICEGSNWYQQKS